jgi:hypothetical protein
VSREEFKKYGELKEFEGIKLGSAEQSEIRKKFFEMVWRRMQLTAGAGWTGGCLLDTAPVIGGCWSIKKQNRQEEFLSLDALRS